MTSAGVQLLARIRFSCRDRSSGCFSQRYRLARAPPTARAAWAAESPLAIACRQRATASRLLAASLSIGFAPRRRDAALPFLITWPGRPKTCMGFSFDSSFNNPSFGERLSLCNPSHICPNLDTVGEGAPHTGEGIPRGAWVVGRPQRLCEGPG